MVLYKTMAVVFLLWSITSDSVLGDKFHLNFKKGSDWRFRSGASRGKGQKKDNRHKGQGKNMKNTTE